MKKLILPMVLLVLFAMTACGNQEIEDEAEDTEEKLVYDEFMVASSSLEDGKWLSVINSTEADPAGENQSPALLFEEVEGAAFYAVYMIDTSASNWVHWIVKDLRLNTLPQGFETDENAYVGPYPPSGTHEYQILVYALKASPDNYPAVLNSPIDDLDEMEAELDVADEKEGNILARGVISGTVTCGEKVGE